MNQATDIKPTSPTYIPDYVGSQFVPDKLDFHFPVENNPVALDDDIEIWYNQLVNWSMIQSYWFWVCSAPKVSDKEYDWMKIIIANTERECEDISTPTEPHVPNGYSPTHTWWGWNSSRYPQYIQEMFRGVQVRMYIPCMAGFAFEEHKEKRYVPQFVNRR